MGEVDTSDDQVASQDEYEISLEEGIEDDSLLESSDVKKFSITSYGADYTVDTLVKRMRLNAFTIPEFQRRFIWSQRHSSKFIESLLMGLPVPGIFLYKEAVTNKHLVIDGQQRLRSLQAFYDGVFSEKKFRLSGIREPWNNKTYAELEPSDQLKMDDSIVHATIFQQDHPADVLDSIYFVFERINSGGIRLSPQEIRNCISEGPFIQLVKKLNKNADWRKVFAAPVNKRAKDEELILRFLAIYKSGLTYYRPMSSFLNDFSSKMNLESAGELQHLEEIFIKTITLVASSLGTRAFRPVRTLNAAVFDAVMSGLASRLERNPMPSNQAVSDIYDTLLRNTAFKKGWERATADEETVKLRLNLAIDAFDNI